jgi:hypothetical protein
VDSVRSASERAARLAERIDAAATGLIHVIEGVDPRWWAVVPAPGVWSVGKEAEHVSEAAAYHLWIVRRAIGDQVASRRPTIERSRLTSDLSPEAAATRIRHWADATVAVVASLTDGQLGLPTVPPRATMPSLAMTIERLVIGHLDGHHDTVAAKLLARGSPDDARPRAAMRRRG